MVLTTAIDNLKNPVTRLMSFLLIALLLSLLVMPGCSSDKGFNSESTVDSEDPDDTHAGDDPSQGIVILIDSLHTDARLVLS